jgi:hypothetical protein
MGARLCLIPLLVLITGTGTFGQSSHYLDCNAGSDTADSLTPQTAWRTVAKADSYVYQPGDSLLLRRGSRCEGMLWPKGSGTEQAPIHLGAYGKGALPVIVGGAESAGLRLSNQQFWEIENLEVLGGSPYGIHIGGDQPVMRHFRITNVIVHDVPGTPLTKDSGLVVIAPDTNAKSQIDDVIIDGVTAYETSEWAGIIVNGAGFDSSDGQLRGEHVEIRNSMVHDVAGDGILLARVSHGVIEHNVAWYTGMQETQSIGTPNGIWEWRCRDCRVAYNEGYFTDSPGVDGGVFDIDYGDDNNLLEHNFAHDSQGYCVSVFGAEGSNGDSSHNEIRQNTCIHNGRSPRLSKRQGAIFLYTWNGGKLNGVQIVDNTVVWDPTVPVPAFQSAAEFTGDLPNRFTRNTVISVPRSFVSSKSNVQFSGNHYYASAVAAPVSMSESDPAAKTPDSMCGALKALLDNSKGTNFSQSGSAPIASLSGADSGTPSWTIAAVLAPENDAGADSSRSQLVLIESMMHQFRSLGLQSVVAPSRPISREELERWRTDWNFDAAVRTDPADQMGLRKANHPAGQSLLLISPSGQVAASWQFPISPADVWLQIQSHLGTPGGAQQMPVCQRAAVQ